MGFLIWRGSTSGKSLGGKCFPIGAAPSGLGAVGKRGKFPPTVSGREIRGREFPSALVFSAGGPLGLEDVVPPDEGIRASGK